MGGRLGVATALRPATVAGGTALAQGGIGVSTVAVQGAVTSARTADDHGAAVRQELAAKGLTRSLTHREVVGILGRAQAIRAQQNTETALQEIGMLERLNASSDQPDPLLLASQVLVDLARALHIDPDDLLRATRETAFMTPTVVVSAMRSLGVQVTDSAKERFQTRMQEKAYLKIMQELLDIAQKGLPEGSNLRPFAHWMHRKDINKRCEIPISVSEINLGLTGDIGEVGENIFTVNQFFQTRQIPWLRKIWLGIFGWQNAWRDLRHNSAALFVADLDPERLDTLCLTINIADARLFIVWQDYLSDLQTGWDPAQHGGIKLEIKLLSSVTPEQVHYEGQEDG